MVDDVTYLPFTRRSVMPRYHHRCSDDLSQLTRFWLIIRVWMVVVAAVYRVVPSCLCYWGVDLLLPADLRCSCVGRKPARLTSRPARQCAVARRST